MEIEDPRKWRISMSGFSIKTGWADEQKYIAKYPGVASPLDNEAFQEWMINAQRICRLHNDSIANIGGGSSNQKTGELKCESHPQ